MTDRSRIGPAGQASKQGPVTSRPLVALYSLPEQLEKVVDFIVDLGIVTDDQRGGQRPHDDRASGANASLRISASAPGLATFLNSAAY